MKVYKPESGLVKRRYDVNHIFLAGTIDNGSSENWQEEAIEEYLRTIEEVEMKDIAVFNPRSDEWNTELEQTLENPEFRKQLEWEYDALCKADIILMNFLPGSKSPITLLELGLFADSGKIILVCPEDFWRKGNVDFVSEIYNIPLFEDLHDAMYHIGDIIKENKITF